MEVKLVTIGGEATALGELGRVEVEVNIAKNALPHASQGLQASMKICFISCHLLPLQQDRVVGGAQARLCARHLPRHHHHPVERLLDPTRQS